VRRHAAEAAGSTEAADVAGTAGATGVAGDPGLFGPDSVSWRIDSEAFVLLGGTAALLMQLAHPAVAAGVAQHSNFQADPFARLRRTLTASFSVVFGSTPRAERALRRIDAVHGVVRGQVPETGRSYDARDPLLLLWVHATLIDTAVRVYDRYVSPLSPDEAEAYHRESRVIATRLGVPEDLVPETLSELREWMAERIALGDVRVTPTARELGRSVLYPTPMPPRWIWDAAHLPSISVLPPVIRRGYGITWNPARRRGADRLAGATRTVLPLLPRRLREVPAARSARRRLAGSHR
jgi:uncharacterized protein (DUF2236 family)